MAYFWMTMIIFLTIIEASTMGLTTIWFVVSAVISLIVSFFVNSLFIQFGIFSIGGLILLITTRPVLKKFLKPKDIKTNLDRVIGMKGIITEEVLPMNNGEVKVNGKRWTAISSQKLPKDTLVKIVEIDGVKLLVEKWEE